MKHKLRFAILLTVVVLLTASLVLLLFYSIIVKGNEGKIVSVDGYLQNTKVYVKDVSYADGIVSLTVVNDTWQKQRVHHAPFLERKEGERWVPIYWETPMLEPRGPKVEAFGELQMSFSLKNALGADITPGEYRFIYGDLMYDYISETPEDITKPIGFTYHPNPPVCVVGSITITEDMLK